MSERLTFKELAVRFDSEYEMLIPLVKTLSKNALQRVLIKLLAFPLRDDKLTVGKGVEERVFESSVTLEQIKINMTLEGVGIDTKELTKKLTKEETNGKIS